MSKRPPGFRVMTPAEIAGEQARVPSLARDLVERFGKGYLASTTED